MQCADVSVPCADVSVVQSSVLMCQCRVLMWQWFRAVCGLVQCADVSGLEQCVV